MKRLLLAVALVLVIVIPALAQNWVDPIAGSPIGDTYAEEYDYETGVALPEEWDKEVEGVVALARTISLLVPATVNNGATFSYTISYSPAITGTWTEQVIFNWPSRCEYLKEKTTRIKKYIGYGGSAIGSSELVAVPSATCVEGIFEANVIVTKGTKIWRAKASMEVINP